MLGIKLNILVKGAPVVNMQLCPEGGAIPSGASHWAAHPRLDSVYVAVDSNI